jgi:hypothetical protein
MKEKLNFRRLLLVPGLFIVGRTNRALKSMQNLGFKHLYSLKGGYDAWKDAELRWFFLYLELPL